MGLQYKTENLGASFGLMFDNVSKAHTVTLYYTDELKDAYKVPHYDPTVFMKTKVIFLDCPLFISLQIILM